MRFGSKGALNQVIVRGSEREYYPNGIFKGFTKELVAEFGTGGPEYVGEAFGSPHQSADISGFFFDSELQATEKGWTDEERQIVEEKVLEACRKFPEYFWQIEARKATAPWPTYDKTPHTQIPLLATTTGTIHEALAYERQNKNRETVVAKLEEALAENDKAAEEALTAA